MSFLLRETCRYYGGRLCGVMPSPVKKEPEHGKCDKPATTIVRILMTEVAGHSDTSMSILKKSLKLRIGQRNMLVFAMIARRL